MWVPNPDAPPSFCLGTSQCQSTTTWIRTTAAVGILECGVGGLVGPTRGSQIHPGIQSLLLVNCQRHASSFCKPTAQVRHDTSQLPKGADEGFWFFFSSIRGMMDSCVGGGEGCCSKRSRPSPPPPPTFTFHHFITAQHRWTSWVSWTCPEKLHSSVFNSTDHATV